MNKKALQSGLPYLDSLLSLRHDLSEMPGYTVAIALDGELIFNKSYGFANLEKKEKLTPEHIFRIASHSKTFTSTAVLQLVEQGKLRLDDYVADHVTWLKEHKDPRWLKVTVRQLLCHSAGVIRDGQIADYWQGMGEFPNEAEFKAIVLESDLVFDTNLQMKYSNIGYGVLGQLVETVSGQSYNSFVIEHIVQPLSLTHTGPELTDHMEHVVTGYGRRGVHKKRKPFRNLQTDALSPATGFCSTSADLVTFIHALMPGTGKLLNDESKKEMQRTQWKVKNSRDDEEYGLGMVVENIHGHRMIGHSGGFPGHHTQTLIDPVDKLTVIVLTNCIDSEIDNVMSAAVTIMDHFEASDLKKDKKNFSTFEGRFMDAWSITDLVSAGDKLWCVFPSWNPFYSPEELEQVDDHTFKITKTNGYDSDGELVHFSFDESGKIASINYCGSTMWPEKTWLEMDGKRTVIGD